jgi:hypothetical protein
MGPRHTVRFDRYVRKHRSGADHLGHSWASADTSASAVFAAASHVEGVPEWRGIDYRVNAAIKEVTADAVILESGEACRRRGRCDPAVRGRRVIGSRRVSATKASSSRTTAPPTFEHLAAALPSRRQSSPDRCRSACRNRISDRQMRSRCQHRRVMKDNQSRASLAAFRVCASWTPATKSVDLTNHLPALAIAVMLPNLFAIE